MAGGKRQRREIGAVWQKVDKQIAGEWGQKKHQEIKRQKANKQNNLIKIKII